MNQTNVPKVFISSTVEDLGPYRAAAENAAKTATFFPLMHEYWVAKGVKPPLEESLRRVGEADVLVVVVAHRYGWVPPGESKSITWLECLEAVRQKKEVLAFLVDGKHSWPEELREEYRLVEAAREGNVVAVAAEVQERVKLLAEFKEWLRCAWIRVEFTNQEDLRGKVSEALREWRERHPEFRRVAVARESRVADPMRYLEDLRKETAYIDIRGLQVGEARAHRFPIEDLFIPLTTTGEGRRGEGRGTVALE